MLNEMIEKWEKINFNLLKYKGDTYIIKVKNNKR